MKPEKNISPALRFPEFHEEWQVQELKSFFEERNEFPKREMPLHSLTIEEGIVPKSERYERSFLVKSEAEAYKVMHQDDFAFNPMNLRLGALARHKGKENVLVSKYYNIFRCNENADPAFVENYLTSYSLIQFYNKMCTGSLDEKKRVHYLDFIKFRLPFPKLPEQKKIAALFLAFDQKIAQLSKKRGLLKQYLKTVIQNTFSQHFRFRDDRGNRFPDWEEVRLESILHERKTFQTKGTGLDHLSLTVEGVVPKSDRYDRDFLVSSGTEKQYKVTRLNDICYNPANLKFGVISRNKHGDGIFSPIYITFEVVKQNIKFIEYLVTRKDFINRARKFEEGTVYERTAVKPADLLRLKVEIPSLPEQAKIADFVSAIEKKITVVDSQLENTKRFKRSLSQQMFV